MKPHAMLMLLLTIALMAFSASAQQSDYEIQQSFEQRYNTLVSKIDSSSTTAALDSLKPQIDALATDFQDKREFLDRALYPDTYEARITALRHLQQVAYDRTSTIQSQGVRITELETTIAGLSSRLDTLTGERAQLFEDLQSSKRSEATLRDAVRRLQANLQTNDKLVFSLMDSIFLPYDRNLRQANDVEKETIAGRLEHANVLTRVYDVATDNVKFLDATQLQGKDYSNLLDQYQQFKNRWNGLSQKLQDVAAASERRGAPAPRGAGAKGRPAGAVIATRSVQVDSVVSEWNAKLQASFWTALEKEFTSRGVNINHFTDAASFASSVRSYVSMLKENGQDPGVFVDQVWKDRVDKEWRDALTKDTMLGKAEYASLDKTVSELNQKKIDLKLIIYIVIIIAIVLAAWWFLSRKPKPPRPETAVGA